MFFTLIGIQNCFHLTIHYTRNILILKLYFFRGWDAGVGPVKDLYTIGENPQYLLEVNNTQHGVASVWILLTRHIMDKVISIIHHIF